MPGVTRAGDGNPLGLGRVLSDLLSEGSGTCLEIGCGTGVHAARVRELGWTPVGVDLSAGMLRHARGGTDRDIAAFAVNTIRAWWNKVGAAAYPQASQVLITADCGGSNGNRVRLWKTEKVQLAGAVVQGGR